MNCCSIGWILQQTREDEAGWRVPGHHRVLALSSPAAKPKEINESKKTANVRTVGKSQPGKGGEASLTRQFCESMKTFRCGKDFSQAGDKDTEKLKRSLTVYTTPALAGTLTTRTKKGRVQARCPRSPPSVLSALPAAAAAGRGAPAPVRGPRSGCTGSPCSGLRRPRRPLARALRPTRGPFPRLLPHAATPEAPARALRDSRDPRRPSAQTTPEQQEASGPRRHASRPASEGPAAASSARPACSTRSRGPQQGSGARGGAEPGEAEVRLVAAGWRATRLRPLRGHRESAGRASAIHCRLQAFRVPKAQLLPVVSMVTRNAVEQESCFRSWLFTP